MLEILLWCSLLLGQFGRISIAPSFTLYAHDIALIVLISISFIQRIRQQKKRTKSVLVTPFLLVAIVCMLSILVNSNRFSSHEVLVGAAYALRYITYFALYIAVRRDQHTSRYWLTWLFLLGIAFSLVGYIQLNVYPDLRNLSYDGWDPHYYRLFSTLLDPNFMGALLILSTMAGIAVLKSAKQKYWSLIGLAIIFVAFIFTFSRSSYVAAIVALLAYIVLSKKWKYMYLLLFFCLAILIVPSIGGESTSLFRQVTALARITNWQEGIQVFFDSPIIGHGFNMIGALPHNAPTLIDGAVSHSSSGYDNSIIFILATTGIVGLVAFSNVARKIIQMGRNVLQTNKHEFGIIYIALSIALLIHSMFVNTLFYPQLMLCFWIFTGAIEKETKGI